MCTHPASVLITKRPSDAKFRTRYFPDMTREEAIRSGLDIDVLTATANGLVARWATVPCGQCMECRLQRSREWANRCLIESEQYSDSDGVVKNWFVTLTVAPQMQNKFLTPSGCLSLDFGRENGRDVLQQFLVSVRQIFEREYHHKGIRFIACGEYGSERFRPHYHLILFNCPLPYSSLIKTFKNKFHHQFYKSPLLERAWKYGFVDISEANWDNMAYTARYVVKKITGDAALDYYGDLKPPFLRASNKPGIGLNGFKGYSTYTTSFDASMYDELVDIETGELVGFAERIKEGFSDRVIFKDTPLHMDASFKPPRYYDKKMALVDGEFMEVVKDMRQSIAEKSNTSRKALLPLSDRDLFSFREEALEKQAIGSVRHLEDIF